jgi:2-methylcitrate dehydratase PrpD
METERRLARYVSDSTYGDLPQETVDIIKKMVLAIVGTTIAGAAEQGCEALVAQVREWAGKEEATILVYGGKVPAYNAALVNGFIARALDFCDAMSPGLHIGASAVPVALAAAELAGGCSGEAFLAALVLGAETAARMNFVSDYDGFEPTGVCSIFAAAVTAGSILRLNHEQMLHALALAFNKAGGSFQSNIDGSLAVRTMQGFAAQGGLVCAQLAQRGITGPENFIEGIYGYLHLYGKDKFRPESVVSELGQRFDANKTIFKRFPSCGCTLSSTDAILDLAKEKNLTPDNVASVEVTVSPYAYKIVGHQFEPGDTPKVNAQFSIQYCVANALLRGSSKLTHFDEPCVMDDRIAELVRRIHVSADPALPEPGKPGAAGSTHLSVRVKVTTKDGSVYHKNVDVPRGNPRNPLSDEEHMVRFYDCVDYARKGSRKYDTDRILSLVTGLEKAEDARSLIPLLLPA